MSPIPSWHIAVHGAAPRSIYMIMRCPEYDNALLSHADRTRIVPKGRRVPLPPGNGGVIGTIVVDGYLRGTWKIVRGAETATLDIEPDLPLDPSDQAALEVEGDALLRFVVADATERVVRVVRVR